MSLTVIGVIGLVVMLTLLFAQMPVGFAMAIAGFVGFIYLSSAEGGLSLLATDFFSTFNSYPMSVIPLFIYMGEIAFHSGMSRRLFNATHKWLGHMPGGLAMATVAGCTGFAAICGSSSATTATMGKVALPEMKKYNYDTGLATGVIAAGGTIGILIPPSMIFIIYGILTRQSISRLFAAGILPGLLSFVYYMITIYILTRRNPNLAPPRAAVSFKEKLKSLSVTWEVLLLFALVMGGLFVGWFTPTEAAGVGAGGALVVALIRRGLNWQGFRVATSETVRMTAMIFITMAGAIIFGHFLTVTKIPYDLAGWLIGLPISPVAILACILGFYVIGGCFVSAMALLILTVPIFFPAIVALGFDPIWFGVIIVMIMEIAAITPPVGINIYILKGIAPDVPIEVIFKGILPFVVADAARLVTLVLLPQIALFLPGMM